MKENLPEKLPTALLGSIVECHVRGLLSEKGTFEFQDIEGHEVDYVNVQDCIALEITISNKRSNEKNFKYLPVDYRQITLTKDVAETYENGMHIPYHEFIRITADAYLNVFLGEESVRQKGMQQNSKKGGR